MGERETQQQHEGPGATGEYFHRKKKVKSRDCLRGENLQ